MKYTSADANVNEAAFVWKKMQEVDLNRVSTTMCCSPVTPAETFFTK